MTYPRVCYHFTFAYIAHDDIWAENTYLRITGICIMLKDISPILYCYPIPIFIPSFPSPFCAD